jgi:hypothetical protein
MRGLIRGALCTLAFAHAFPASKHLGAFFAVPALADFWKGSLALVAVLVYLTEPIRLARALVTAWRRARPLLTAGAVVLVVVHLVPAFDHVPRFVAAPTWADGWRGIGACFASVWFALSVPMQARLLAALPRWSAAPRWMGAASVPRATPQPE